MDCLFMTLMMLRSGLPRAVAGLFGATKPLVIAITTTWIAYLHERLLDLNPFPTREQVNSTRPKK